MRAILAPTKVIPPRVRTIRFSSAYILVIAIFGERRDPVHAQNSRVIPRWRA